MNNRIFLSLVLILFSNFLYSQEIGHPFVRNYLPSEYKGETQIWAIEQDTLGYIYLAGNTGIHVFNGTRWSKIEFPNDDVCRSLTKADNGKIYAGSVGEFGYIEFDPSGKQEYKSLVYLLDSAESVFTDVWSVEALNNKVYFHTMQSVFIYDYTQKVDSLKIKVIEDEIYVFKKVNNNILVETKQGFLKIQNDTLATINKKIYPWLMLPFSKSETFILDSETKSARVLRSEDWTDVTNDYFSAEKAKSIYKKLGTEQCYSYTSWKDSLFVFGTLSAGILILDKNGNFIDQINEDSGLENNSVMTLFVDKRNQIWAGTSNGAAYIEYNSPIRQWTKKDGIIGAIYGISKIQNQLYVQTSLGLYAWSKNHFIPIPEVSSENGHQVFSSDSYDIPGYGNIALISTSRGIWQLVNGHAKQKIEATNYFIVQSPFNKKRFYYSDENYFVQFDYADSIKADTIYEFSQAVDFVCEYPQNNFWFTAASKVFKLEKKDTSFTLIDNIDSQNIQIVDIFIFNNSLYFSSKTGIYKLENNRLVADDKLLGNFYNKNRIEFSTIDSLPNKDFMAVVKKEDKYQLHYINRQNNTISIDSFLYNRIPELDFVSAESNKQIFVSGTKEAYSIQLHNQNFDLNCVAPAISRLQINQDSIIYPYNLHTSYSFSYENNDILFYFNAAFFDYHEKNQFSYLLEGSKQKNWSAWSSEAKKEFTNLSEGEYTLKLKVKNAYNKISPSTNFHFIVKPPYYRTTLAYSIYLLLFIAFIYLIIKLYTRKLKAENDRLEEIVRIRTAEINQQKEEIMAQAENLKMLNDNITTKNAELTQQKEEIQTQAENMLEINTLLSTTNSEIKEQKEIIDKKNQAILASIQYAKRIQKAVLRLDKVYESTLPEHFIFLKPRDIVSGDFYFIKNIRQILGIAAVDCTGHGVPGAFMSMLGTAFLTDIIHNRSITTASAVLDTMRQMVKQSLNQHDSILTSKDGMDMSLFAIDLDSYQAQFAGAHNSLFLFRNNELIEYKGDPMPIGISRKERKFSNYSFKIEKEDVIYLFSDGFYDQFGGTNGRKYNKANFKSLLKRIHQEPMFEQSEIIKNEFAEWKGENQKQLDDILVMGFRF